VMNHSRTLIITVNFRQNECTLQFLESASRLEGFSRCHVLIVDNNSGDGSVDRIREAIARFCNVELLVSSNNRGYFGGAKWALNEYLGHHAAPDWVIVCNNDVVWNQRSFLSSLLTRDPHTEAVLAPAVVSRLTGFDANPMINERPGWMRMLRYRILLSSYYLAWFTQWLAPFAKKARKVLQSTRRPRGVNKRAIYAPHGAMFVFSRRFFEAGGFIDDGAFLYAEELRIAEMCRHLGLPIIHDPGLRVWHEEGRTLGRLLTRETYLHQKNGFNYAATRYQRSYFEPGFTLSRLKTKKLECESDCRYISAAGDRGK
jgi:GT2 family glycosyltransferase